MTNPCQEAEDSLLACTIDILSQPITLLESTPLSDASLRFESQIVQGSSAAKHFRHVHDHIRILLDAIENWQTIGTDDKTNLLWVDYDVRCKQRLPEFDSVIVSEFETIIQRLKTIFTASKGTLYCRRIQLRATTPFVIDMESTVARELWFCGLHAIHHYALIRVILVNELKVYVDHQFGVAPSTLVHRHWKRQSSDVGGARL